MSSTDCLLLIPSAPQTPQLKAKPAKPAPSVVAEPSPAMVETELIAFFIEDAAGQIRTFERAR